MLKVLLVNLIYLIYSIEYIHSIHLIERVCSVHLMEQINSAYLIDGSTQSNSSIRNIQSTRLMIYPIK